MKMSILCAMCGGAALLLSNSLSAAPDPLEAATQMEEAFTKVAEKAFPAVVVITSKRLEKGLSARGMYEQLPEEFRRFFGLPDDGQGQAPARREGRQTPVPVGKGSGFLFRDSGYILTNNHVIEDADALEVKLHDGRIFDNAKNKNDVIVVGTDKETDLAVLRIGDGKLKGLPVLPFADSTKIKIGQFAIAIGAPFNLDYSVSVGHVSQKGRYEVNINTYENYIQTDASINPGNSGGPLLNLRGEVMGVNEFIMTGGGFSRGSIGLSFAISSNLAKQVADSIIENKGTVIRPWLGISMQPLTEDLKQQFKVKFGVLVNDVFKDDPADKAGLKAGDVILKVGDTEIRTPHDVQFAVLSYKPGDKIPLRLDRNGKELTLQVIARQKEGADVRTAQGGPAQGGDLEKLGLKLEDGKNGVMVTAVTPGSVGAAEFRRGDVILEVNRHPVKTVAEVDAAVRDAQGEAVIFYIERRGAKFFVPLQLETEK